jgi:uncharacterized protein
MIRIDISEIPEGHSHLSLTCDPADLEADLDEVRLASDVDLELDVSRNGDEMLFRGTARTRAEVECARCLKAFLMGLEAALEFWCILSGKTAGDEQVPERDNVVEAAADATSIDVTDMVRSELLVLLPLKTLCRADCRGLCPVCGVDLNESTCSCSTEITDSRWDALKKLKQDR